jgi:hypothetical protein
MLHFVYTDSLPRSGDSDGDDDAFPTVMAQNLLAAADRYGLDRLRSLCESRLCEEVNVQTVATTLALAEKHHSTQLKAVCLKFVAANLTGISLLLLLPILDFLGFFCRSGGGLLNITVLSMRMYCILDTN